MRPTKPLVSPFAQSTTRPAPPYDTGKVKIGLCYTPPPNWSASRDALTLQTALLSRPVYRPTLTERLVAFLRSFV
jgi:hypothetical protein